MSALNTFKMSWEIKEDIYYHWETKSWEHNHVFCSLRKATLFHQKLELLQLFLLKKKFLSPLLSSVRNLRRNFTQTVCKSTDLKIKSWFLEPKKKQTVKLPKLNLHYQLLSAEYVLFQETIILIKIIIICHRTRYF